jgi:hypothetical protein
VVSAKVADIESSILCRNIQATIPLRNERIWRTGRSSNQYETYAVSFEMDSKQEADVKYRPERGSFPLDHDGTIVAK